MWDLIVSVPDHCLSFYFPLIMHKNDQMYIECDHVTKHTESFAV